MVAVENDYETLKRKISDALEPVFPDGLVDISPVSRGRAWVVVVSHRFDGVPESEKQEILWEILRDKLGDDAQGVSMAIGWGVDELR